MANRIVTATVTGETIKLSSKNAGTAGSDRAVSLAITFDSTWDSTPSKIVQFLDTYGANPVNITLTSGMIVGGAYIVPIRSEPLKYAGEMTVTIRGVEFEVDGTTVKRVIMSASTIMNVQNSLYNPNGATPVEPTPTQAEQLLTAVNSVTGMTVSATALSTGAPATVTKTTNVDETINLAFGLPAGGKGDTGNTGATGATGNGISSVVLNGDYTLTINFTDSTSTTTTSIRGATGATGATGDTGATGKGISSVVLQSGTHAAGTTDTYRITFTDATTFDFTVYNGADGEGAGDMLASVYDPNAKNADAFSMTNMVEGTTNKIFTATERTKLSGIATGATANSTDATLLDRANHTGTQSKSTISDFSHTHGNITNDGKVGSTADLPVFTTTAGVVTTKTIADAKTLLGITESSYVKLLSTTVGTSAESVTLDLSALSTLNYCKLIVEMSLSSSINGSTSFQFNGLSTLYYTARYGDTNATSAQSNMGTLTTNSTAESLTVGVIELEYNPALSVSQPVMTHLKGFRADGNMTKMIGVRNVDLTSGITSINITAPSTGNIQVGSRFIVYGVKV